MLVNVAVHKTHTRVENSPDKISQIVDKMMQSDAKPSLCKQQTKQPYISRILTHVNISECVFTKGFPPPVFYQNEADGDSL